MQNVTGKINFRGTDDEAYTKIIFKNQFEAELDTKEDDEIGMILIELLQAVKERIDNLQYEDGDGER